MSRCSTFSASELRSSSSEGLATAEAPRPISDAAKRRLFASLTARFGDRFSTGASIREQHAHALTWIRCEPPDAVLFAETTEEVVEVVRLCAEARMPVIPFGTGTSLEGHVNAPFGGLSLDLSRINCVIAVHDADLDCVVEPGVTRKALDEHLRDLELFFPIDPGADASLGGMAVTRASGTMRDNVLSLTAVLADGTLLRTGQFARNRRAASTSPACWSARRAPSASSPSSLSSLTASPRRSSPRSVPLRHHRRRLQRHHRRHADGLAASPHRARR